MTQEREPLAWLPRDLSSRLPRPLEPSYWQRSDGRSLIYGGKTHWFIGPSESCKTWAALLLIAQAIKQHYSVLVLDYEDGLDLFCHRMIALGVDVDQAQALGLLTYIDTFSLVLDRYGRPTDNYSAYEAAVLNGGPYAVIVIDGVTNAFLSQGLDPMSNSDAALWVSHFPHRIALATEGAVVSVDHVAKAAENGQRFAIGAQHKIASVTGAVYSFEPVRYFARTPEGQDSYTGVVNVTVGKDRPGYVRALTTPEGLIGRLELTSWADGGVTGGLLVPSTEAESATDEVLTARLLEHISIYPGEGKRAIRTAMGARAGAVDDCLKWLLRNDCVEVRKEGRTLAHYLTQLGAQRLATEEDQ